MPLTFRTTSATATLKNGATAGRTHPSRVREMQSAPLKAAIRKSLLRLERDEAVHKTPSEKRSRSEQLKRQLRGGELELRTPIGSNVTRNPLKNRDATSRNSREYTLGAGQA